MKIKNSHIMFFLIAVLGLLLIAARPFQDAGPVDGPAPLQVSDGIRLALTMGIGFLLTNGLKSFSQTAQGNKYLKWFPDLSGLATSTTTAVVTVLILFANMILAAVPAAFVPAVQYGSLALAAIFGAFGIHFTVKGFQPDKPQLTKG